jgi:flavodoxin
MNEKISRREVLRWLALGLSASLAACINNGKSTTSTGQVMETNDPQVSQTPGISSSTATLLPNPTTTQPPAVSPTGIPPAPFSTLGSKQSTPSSGKVLLAFFSRAGENYYYGGRTHLDVGNTEVLAGMISQRIKCDIYRIEPADPYPDDYEETVARNVREQKADARPAITNPLDSIASYNIVMLGSPIWNVRAPMIMTTFVEGFDFTGKTLIPFTTHAMSGLGTTVRDYSTSCPGAIIGEGLAVRGEEVHEAGDAVEAWLRRIGLHRG